jgi:hypothetical protein
MSLFDNRFNIKADRIVDLSMVENNSLTFMVAEAGQVSVVRLEGEIIGNDLFRGGLRCATLREGTQQLTVEYLGVCGSDYRW